MKLLAPFFFLILIVWLSDQISTAVILLDERRQTYTCSQVVVSITDWTCTLPDPRVTVSVTASS
jgi:hypothetical protein